MRTYRSLFLLVICLSVLLMTACTSGGGSGQSSPPAPSSSGGGGTSAPTPAPGPAPGPAPEPAADDFKWPEVISFATPSQGSSSHVAATIIADMLKSKTGIRQVVIEPYGNAGAMVRPLSEGQVDFAFHGGYREFTDGYEGVFAFEKDGSQNVKSLMYFSLDPWAVLVTDSNIKQFADLKGKTIVLMTNNRDHINVLDAYLEMNNMTRNDITILPATSVQNAYEALRDGKAQAYPFGMAPALQEVKTARGLWGLPVSDEEAKFIMEKEPTRLQFTIKAGETVLAPEQDLPVLGLPLGVAVNADLDEELVYRITKLIYEESQKALFDAKPSHERNWKPEAALDVFTFPAHDGLIRYLKENNLWTDELQKKQEQLTK